MVVMGHISGPFGIKGWIKIHPYTEALDGLLDYPVWWVGKEPNWRELKVIESAVHGKSLIARIEQCADRDAAERIKGSQIAVPRALLPESDEGEFYWSDLVGL